MKEVIGIVGGGQLGLMLGQAAQKLDFDIHILEKSKNCPASSIAKKIIIGGVKNGEKITELAQESNFLTFEIESADAVAMKKLIQAGKIVNPRPETLLTIKDKFGQKEFFIKNGVPVAESREINNLEDAEKFGEELGFPFLLKAKFDAYDGKGNAVVKSKSDISSAMKKLGNKNLYGEKFVNFSRELAVMAVRTMKEEVKTYPTVETIHKNNICHTVYCPAEISREIDEKCQKLATKVVKLFNGAGVFGIEMFLTEDEEVVVNEIAPRVHNSGHHTIEACETSQFENHIRAISGLGLGDTKMKVPAAVMINILGTCEGTADFQGKDEAEKIAGISVHWYNKEENRVERKMGHLTAVAETLEIAEKNAIKALKLLKF